MYYEFGFTKRTYCKEESQIKFFLGTLQVEAARPSQTLATLYKSTRHGILEGCNILQQPSENLNSHRFRLTRISQFLTSLPSLMEIISIFSDMKPADGL